MTIEGVPVSHDIFISYSTHDKAIADEACRALEARGITCWIAPRDVRPGALWGEEIIDAINGSRIMVLVLSSHSNDSPQVIREVERACSKGLPLISVRIENVRLSKSMEYFVSTHHWLDGLSPPLGPVLTRLGETAEAILSAGGSKAELKGNSSDRTGPGHPRPVRRRRTWMRAAAAILLLGGIGLGLAIFLGRSQDPPSSPAKETKPIIEKEPKKDVENKAEGHIEIEAIPSGAQVYIDDRLEGSAPLRKAVAPGSYRIRVSKGSEYRDSSDTVTLAAGGTFSKKYVLDAIYVLKITTKPEGADVFIDDTPQGKTPLTMTWTSSLGRLRIEKGLEWSRIDDQIRLAPGINTLQYSLEPRTHRLVIQTIPSGGRVVVNDEEWGPSPVARSVLAGTHRLKVHLSGYRSLDEALIIGSDLEKSFVLEKRAPGKIWLRVQPFADVSVDGKPIGEVPPKRSCDLDEGSHVFEFVSSRLDKRLTVEVQVKSGESQEILVNMETGEYRIVRLTG